MITGLIDPGWQSTLRNQDSQMPKIRFICQRCGAPFERYPSQIRPGGTFCSRRCHNVKTGEQRTCPTCGISFYVNRSTIEKGEGIYCSRRCGNAARGRSGPSNGNWKGGRFQRSDGYIAVAVGEGKYRLEHDLVMEEHIGRRLHQGENSTTKTVSGTITSLKILS